MTENNDQPNFTTTFPPEYDAEDRGDEEPEDFDPDHPPYTEPAFAFDEEGVCYNPNNGEVYDPEDAARFTGLQEAIDGAKDPIVIDTFEAADGALRKLAELHGSKAKLSRELAAVTTGYEKRIAAVDRRIKWWELRFKGPILKLSRELRGKRSKTMQYSWGAVSEKSVAGRAFIIDKAAAKEWSEKYAPDAVRWSYSVQAAAIEKARKAVETEIGEPLPLPFMGRKPDAIHSTIDTGVLLDSKEGIKHVE